MTAPRAEDELRDEVAAVLASHAGVEQFTKPGRRKGLTEWGARCLCGAEMPWKQDDRVAAHRAHLADALLPLIREREARLVAGAADEPGPVNAVPTPGQLLRRLFDADAEQRLAWAARAIENSERDHRCFMQNHDARIAHLKREVQEARDGAVEVRARVEAIHRPSTDHGARFNPYCVGCWEAGGEDGAPTYPCPTIAALADTDGGAR